MPIDLSHLGEDLIAEMLRSLARRKELNRIVCGLSGRSLDDDIQEFGLGETIDFRPEDASLVILNGTSTYSCDGEQKVDVLCTGSERAIAIESKLGETRMGSSEFRKRFCMCCEISRHSDNRMSGSMIAVLERSLPFEGDSDLVARIEGVQWTIVKPWWLVVRRGVFNKWIKNNDVPFNSARILLFDSLAQAYGSRQQFDQMVQRVVGSDFAGRWKIPLNDP